MSRFLVTTSNPRTWRQDEPMLFLGQWCLRYHHYAEARNLDIVFAEPFGVSPEAKARDNKIVRQLYGVLLSELTDALNVFHGTNRSRRYWQIVLGTWLFRAVSTLYNRYHAVAAALEAHNVGATSLYEASTYTLATTDTAAAARACDNDFWNHVLYGRVLSQFEGVAIERLPRGASDEHFFSTTVAPNLAGSAATKTAVLNAAQSVLRHLVKPNDAVIVNSYLPKVTEAKFNLLLGQVPAFWQSPALDPVAPAPHRHGFRLDTPNRNAFDRFLRVQLAELLPTCFLEGYAALTAQVRALPWPDNPRFIFTSNNFDTDEIFKAWTAEKAEAGTPYFVGQHGNHGVSPYVEGDFEAPEAVTADRFISWGLTSDDHPHVVPAFIFKAAGRSIKRRVPDDGSLLLIEQFLPTRKMHWDTDWEYAIYQEEQFRFVAELPDDIRRSLNLRLHAQFRNSAWEDFDRWKDRYGDVTIDDGTVPMRTLTARARLVVHSYDSTGILETLYHNIPTMAFWHGGMSHLFPQIKPHYEKIQAVGILHDKPESAAKFIAGHWEDIDGWWGSDEVQSARRLFCDTFAHMVPQPLTRLRSILTSNVSKGRSN
jgi:putative transferase (TIGR04331 family)